MNPARDGFSLIVLCRSNNVAVEDNSSEYATGNMKSSHIVDRNSSIPSGPQDSNTPLKLKLVKESCRYTTPIPSLDSFWSIPSRTYARTTVPVNENARVILLVRIVSSHGGNIYCRMLLFVGCFVIA